MQTPYDTRLPPHLRALKEEIEGYARGYGLDFYETIFEVVDADDLNEIAAYGGFPTRYPHWSFGMSYEELRKGYDYGLSKIYELVINNDPCYAYLMRSNHDVDQKLVMAHVYGHCDFFKNNAYFGHTNRKMMDEMANHGARLRFYTEKYGEDEVEAFVDRCMSIDDLIDIHSTAIRRRKESARYDFTPESDKPDDVQPTRFKSKDYMDDYINPRDVLKAEEDERRKQKEQTARNFPENPEKDILLFLLDFAPLKPWQRDVLSIIRDEAYYFAPQGQTKIINEGWACVVGDSLVLTDQGILRMEEIVRQRQAVSVSDGDTTQAVYDHARFPNRTTVRIRTRRGFEIEGSTTHRVQLADGSWRRLDEICLGDRMRLALGTDLWASEKVQLDTATGLATLRRSVALPDGESSQQRFCEASLNAFSADSGGATALLETRLDVALGLRHAFCRGMILKEQSAVFLGQVLSEEYTAVRNRNSAWSREESLPEEELLEALGLLTESSESRNVPDVVLRSPRSVVVAFLRGLFDVDAEIEPDGVVLESSSAPLSKTIQVLLLNLGICSTRSEQGAGWRIQIQGGSARKYQSEIGFGSERKQEALRDYLQGRSESVEVGEDEIVDVEFGQADVFDVSVKETHRYAAGGFINHNSYWHSTIMTQKALCPSEVIDYADHHSGTMAMQRNRLNPYKLGIELLRDIEQRWNMGRFGKEYDECDDLEKKRTWDKQVGLGRQKIFEVRRIHNDITFIDNFLTPEFCVQHGLFSYAYQEQAGQYIIESREFEKIKQRLLFSLTNFGKPWIYVVDGNYRNRGELLLKHQHNGVELRLDQAADTLANIQFIWSRPVHLQTVVDGKPTMLSFDGTDHSIRTGGDNDDARRNPPAKTR